MFGNTSKTFTVLLKELSFVYQILSKPAKTLYDHELNYQAIVAFTNRFKKMRKNLTPEEQRKMNQVGMSLIFNWLAMKCYNMNFGTSIQYLQNKAIYN